jgi:hypothetical protein
MRQSIMATRRIWLPVALAGLLVGVGLLLLSASGSAHPPYYPPPPPPPPEEPQVTVTLESTDGAALRVYYHGGSAYVLGRYGQRYNVRIRNHSSRRVEAVLSIDGRDAVSGEPADYVRHRGYLVPAYGSVIVEGFRQNLDGVAAFRFTDPRKSYSSRMGTPENVGVVGVAVFAERVRRPIVRRPPPEIVEPQYDEERRYRSNRDEAGASPEPAPRPKSQPAPEATDQRPSSAPRGSGRAEGSWEREAPSSEYYDDGHGYGGRRDNLGTEYGERLYSPVREVEFVRENRRIPSRVVRLRYDDAEGLRARGIEVEPRPRPYPPRWQEPEPFPGRRFAPPPP